MKKVIGVRAPCDLANAGLRLLQVGPQPLFIRKQFYCKPWTYKPANPSFKPLYTMTFSYLWEFQSPPQVHDSKPALLSAANMSSWACPLTATILEGNCTCAGGGKVLELLPLLVSSSKAKWRCAFHSGRQGLQQVFENMKILHGIHKVGHCLSSTRGFPGFDGHQRCLFTCHVYPSHRQFWHFVLSKQHFKFVVLPFD